MFYLRMRFAQSFKEKEKSKLESDDRTNTVATELAVVEDTAVEAVVEPSVVGIILCASPRIIPRC